MRMKCTLCLLMLIALTFVHAEESEQSNNSLDCQKQTYNVLLESLNDVFYFMETTDGNFTIKVVTDDDHSENAIEALAWCDAIKRKNGVYVSSGTRVKNFSVTVEKVSSEINDSLSGSFEKIKSVNSSSGIRETTYKFKKSSKEFVTCKRITTVEESSPARDVLKVSGGKFGNGICLENFLEVACEKLEI